MSYSKDIQKSNGSKLGIAFGAGGVKGLAHIGILQVLDEHGIKADIVAGTSAGSAIASLYATGYTGNMLYDLVKTVDFKKLFPFTINKMGFTEAKGYQDLISECTKGKKIEEADIPLRILAVDMKKWQKIVIKNGDIALAVRASSGIPGVFTPIEKDDLFLVDGHLLNDCPDDEVYKMGANKIIAINLVSKNKTAPKNIVEILFRYMEIANKVQEIKHADIILSPDLADIGTLDFKSAQHCIKKGRAVAEENISDIKALLNS